MYVCQQFICLKVNILHLLMARKWPNTDKASIFLFYHFQRRKQLIYAQGLYCLTFKGCRNAGAFLSQFRFAKETVASLIHGVGSFVLVLQFNI